MWQDRKVLVTGSTGLIGKALTQQLLRLSYDLLTPSHTELDLRDQDTVFNYFNQHKPDYVFHLAAIVGGIHANHAYPSQFIYDNTQMHCNVIAASHRYGVSKLLFPGSACTYPKTAPQPITEAAFLNGLIEPTNIAYAAAKINGIIMCQSYAREHGLAVALPMPTNAYGIGDNFNPKQSHVIPALMQRIHDAKVNHTPEIALWGTGTPLREFIYADDVASAFIFLMEHYESYDIINVGTMHEISILQLAKLIAEVVGYQGNIVVDTSKPDGAPRKCLDSARLFELGWKPQGQLAEGLRKVYEYHFNRQSVFHEK